MFRGIEDEKLQEIISNSTSISEVLVKISLKPFGYNHTELSRYLKENDFDTYTLVGRKKKRFDNTGIPKKTLSQQLTINGTRNSNSLKKRLIKEGVKEKKCERCGISEWMGEDITLELHHINGNRSDNRLENLVLLCPNCHSQTSNFRGKNSSIDLECLEIAKQNATTKMEYLLKKEEERKKEIYQNKLKSGEVKTIPIKEKKVKRYCVVCGEEIKGGGIKFCSYKCMNEEARKNIPSKEELLNESLKHKSLESLSKIYNISSNGCKKWLNGYGIYEEVKDIFKRNKKR